MRRLHCLCLVTVFMLTACGGVALTPTPSPAPPTRTPLPNLDPGRTLAPGNWHAAVYHAGLGEVVLVNGGPEVGKPPDEPLSLWAWDGHRWRLINEDGPPWRNFASVAYDAGRDVLVVYGGLQSRSRRFAELWEWDGAGWTQRPVDGPGPREAAGLVYDEARGQVVLFGGAVGEELAGDTWGWDGQAWTLLSRTGPAPRFPGAMAYDPLSQRVLLYGGHAPQPDGAAADRGDLWAWDGAAWTELPQGEATPGIRTSAALAPDPLTGGMLLYGGSNEAAADDNTWLWDGAAWSRVPVAGPGPRTFHSLAFDQARQRLVLFGGFNRPMSPGMTDTWEWDGAAWTCAAGC